MSGNPFSKKMCHELLLYEDYLLSCKPSLLHKDQIVVDRQRTLGLIAELRSYHCADRSEAVTQADNDGVDEPSLEENVAHDVQMPQEVAFADDDAYQAIIATAQKDAERILAEAREQAKYLINEATIKADVLLKQAEEGALEKQKQIDTLLEGKINDAQKRAKELIDRAHQHAEAELESKNKQMQNMMLASFQKADHLVGIAEEVYTKQLAIIRQDRQEVLEILETLAQRKPK